LSDLINLETEAAAVRSTMPDGGHIDATDARLLLAPTENPTATTISLADTLERLAERPR
jgi:hypothetical protein